MNPLTHHDRWDDDALRQKLRAVEIPNDLSLRLLQIADCQDARRVAPRPISRGGKRLIDWRVLAASLAIVGLGLTYVLLERGKPTPHNSAAGRIPSNSVDDWSKDEQLQRISRDFKQIERSLAITELQQTRQRAQLAKRRFKDSTIRVDEHASMIFCLADRAALDFGASWDFVFLDLQKVMHQFPMTHGALMAEQLIEQQQQFQ